MDGAQRNLSEVLLGVAQTLTANLDLHIVLPTILNQLANLVHFDSASLMLMEGDLLRSVARRLKQCLRRGDTLTRHRSDEFAVLLPDINDLEDTRAIAGKILLAFRKPFPIGDDEITVTISMGIALHPEDGTTANDLPLSALSHAVEADLRELSGEGCTPPTPKAVNYCLQ